MLPPTSLQAQADRIMMDEYIIANKPMRSEHSHNEDKKAGRRTSTITSSDADPVGAGHVKPDIGMYRSAETHANAGPSQPNLAGRWP